MLLDIVNIVEDWGFIDDAIALVAFLIIVGLVLSGLAPALYRLGNGLARRKIAIFASPGPYGELRQLLLDSKLFKARNITHIHSPTEIDVAEKRTVFLIYWPDWKDRVPLLVAARRPSVPCIVYAPRAEGLIPEADMKRLDEEHRHTIVTNFRGRLLNDIVTAMITTSYER